MGELTAKACDKYTYTARVNRNVDRGVETAAGGVDTRLLRSR